MENFFPLFGANDIFTRYRYVGIEVCFPIASVVEKRNCPDTSTGNRCFSGICFRFVSFDAGVVGAGVLGVGVLAMVACSGIWCVDLLPGLRVVFFCLCT